MLGPSPSSAALPNFFHFLRNATAFGTDFFSILYTFVIWRVEQEEASILCLLREHSRFRHLLLCACVYAAHGFTDFDNFSFWVNVIFHHLPQVPIHCAGGSREVVCGHRRTIQTQGHECTRAYTYHLLTLTALHTGVCVCVCACAHVM